MKKYELTEEHKAQLEPWKEKWQANALSTKPMDDNDKAAMRTAITGLYEAANLKPPQKILFVSSPFVLRYLGGFLAAIHYLRSQPNQTAVIEGVTYKAPDISDTDLYHKIKTIMITGVNDRIHNVNNDALNKLSDELGLGKLGTECVKSAYNMWQGGNQWSAYVSFLSFFRHVAKLGETHGVDYSKWDHWEKACIHGGPRIMHAEFCIVSDRPTVLKIDTSNRPHCDYGPFCEYSDGSVIYALNGVYVPGFIFDPLIPTDEKTKRILGIANTEQRMAAMRYVGLSKFLTDLKAELLDQKDEYKLYTIEIENTRIGPYLLMTCPSTGREFLEGVGDATKYDNVDPTIKTVDKALQFRYERASKKLVTNMNLKNSLEFKA